MDAGEYWGWLMIEGAKAGAQVTIAKVTPVVKQQPRPTSLTYGETLGDSEFRNGAMKVSETDAPVQPEQPSDTKEDVVPAGDEDVTEQPDTTPAKLGMRAGRTTKGNK